MYRLIRLFLLIARTHDLDGTDGSETWQGSSWTQNCWNFSQAVALNQAIACRPSASCKSDDLLGISAGKVREQLEVARSLGLVEVRSGTGMRLRAWQFTPAVRLSLFCALALDEGNFELFSELRKHLELAFWDEACALLNDDDLNALEDCMERAPRQARRRRVDPDSQPGTPRLSPRYLPALAKPLRAGAAGSLLGRLRRR